MPISKPSHYVESIEILTEPERGRRRIAQEKNRHRAGNTGARSIGVGRGTSARRQRQPGVRLAQAIPGRQSAAVKAGESVVPASELAAVIKEIKELQRLLGKKTLEVEILKEAVDWGRSKNLITRSPLLPGDDR